MTGKNSFRYVPPGWTDWCGLGRPSRRQRHAHGGTYNYFHVLLNHNGTDRRHAKGQLPDRRPGPDRPAAGTRYHRSAEAVLPVLRADRPALRAPRARATTRAAWSGPAPAAGEVQDPRPAGRGCAGRFDRQITRASGLPPDGSESQRDVSRHAAADALAARAQPPGEAAMLTLTRQRAEALSVLDQQIGRLVATLKRTGEYDNTVLMFTSDNGYFLGEHRMRQGKIWTHEPSLRVPFVVAGPGIPHGPALRPGLHRGHRRDHPGPRRRAAPASRRRRLGGAVVRPRPGLAGAGASPRGRRPTGCSRRAGSAARLHRRADHDRRPHARWKYVRYIDGDAELYDLTATPTSWAAVRRPRRTPPSSAGCSRCGSRPRTAPASRAGSLCRPPCAGRRS